MDILTITGLILGIGMILIGLTLEGGHLAALINIPALIIVLGGSFGAILLQSSMDTFVRALKIIRWIIYPPSYQVTKSIKGLMHWSSIARKEGLLALEKLIEKEPDLFVRKGMQLLVDGNEPDIIRETMEIELINHENRDFQAAKVYESLGAYTPTLGILGAVMGLIHVLGNLSEPEQLGSGIAIAFVATIYGVGFANLIFIPISSKLKALIQRESLFKEMLIEGIVAIAEGENPRAMQGRLSGFFK